MEELSRILMSSRIADKNHRKDLSGDSVPDAYVAKAEPGSASIAEPVEECPSAPVIRWVPVRRNPGGAQVSGTGD